MLKQGLSITVRGMHPFSATPPKPHYGIQPNFHSFLKRMSSCAPPILFFDHIDFWGFPCLNRVSVLPSGGMHPLSATPPKPLDGIQPIFHRFIIIVCTCAPTTLFLDNVHFWGFPY